MKNIFLVIALIFVVAVGCKLPASLTGSNSAPAANGTNSSPDTGSKPVGKISPSGDAKADVVAASKKFIELPAFTADMSGTGDNPIHMRLEYASPDRYHITQLAGPAGGMETIIIGKNTYMKSGATWTKMPVNIGDSIPSLRDSFTEEGLKTLTDVKFDGNEDVDGKPALAYSYKNKVPKADTTFTSRIFVSSDTGLPIKVVVDYGSGPLKQMTIKYDNESKVTIESPMP